jgi:hypothetical protein
MFRSRAVIPGSQDPGLGLGLGLFGTSTHLKLSLER